MSRKPVVSAVVLNWNGERCLLPCLRSLQQSAYPLYETIVVDNHSTDSSVALVRAKFPDAIVLENKKNLGAAAGRNVGLRRALARPVHYVFTLDNDLVVEPDTVLTLISYAEKDERIGVVGAKIYESNRAKQIWAVGFKIDYTQNVTRNIGTQEEDKGQYEQLHEVDAVGTGAMLTAKRVYEDVGLLDESFIGYGFEDTDFCVRARKKGYRVVVGPAAKAWHAPHSGIGHYTYKKKYLETRNAVLFMRKHGTPSSWLKYVFFYALSVPAALAVRGLRGDLAGVRGKLEGFFDGLRKREDKAWSLLGGRPEGIGAGEQSSWEKLR
jgi:GT2 family glycosyltransferase